MTAPTPWFARVRHLLRNLITRPAVERELDDELDAFVAMRAAELEREGMSAAAARRAARIELGGTDHVKDAVRDARSGSTLEATMRDARYAVRTLVRRPAFTIVAVAALGLGIGATTAIFSVVNGVLLRALPYRDPDALVAVMHDVRNPVAPANYLDWKRENTVFSAMGAADYWSGTVAGETPERVQGLRVTSDIFTMVGVTPLLGRVFRPEDDLAGAESPVVLSWGFWQRRFAGRANAIGQTIRVDGAPYTVVGVMPRGFDFPMFWATGVQLYAPLVLGTRSTSRQGQSLRVFARLAPASTLDAARAQMTTITTNLERTFPGTNRNVTVTPLATLVVGDVRPALYTLLGAVVFVLLIACANVAHMLLARATARHREMTVRLALGASRGRLVRQVLTESVLLALGGGIVGVVLAGVALRSLLALAGASLPRSDSVGLDGWVLAFTAVVSVATGLLFGLLPAVRASRDSMASALRDGARGSTEGAARSRLRDALVVSEVALALMLLTGAGLAIRSFVALRAVDPGFESRGVLTAIVSLRGTAEESPDRRRAFYEAALDRVRQVPGVASASYINHLPIAGDAWGTSFVIEGRPRPRAGEAPRATYRVAFPGYFGTMGIRLVHGRDFAITDREGAPKVVVVNDLLARRYWPDESAIGKRLALDTDSDEPEWFTVVGVTANDVQTDWTAPPYPEVFLPYHQTAQYLTGTGGHVAYLTLVVRAACPPRGRCAPASLAPAVRAAIADVDRAVPVTSVQTMDAVVAGANARPRFTLVMFSVFAGVALVLAALGIYGVIAYAVSRRAHEIGVRIALGATPARVIRSIVGQGMRVVGIGLVIGLAGAAALARVMTSTVYGVRASDPLTYLAVATVLVLVALAASYLPARRATRIDPLVAMRAD